MAGGESQRQKQKRRETQSAAWLMQRSRDVMCVMDLCEWNMTGMVALARARRAKDRSLGALSSS